MHAPGPLETLNLPGPHDEQGPPLLPAVPALHLQSDRLSLPDAESEFKGHAVHADSAVAPADVKYFPDLQLLHGALPVTALNLPASHS